MYDAIIDILHGVWKNGFSLTALGTAVFVLLKQRKVKKRLRRYIPWLLDDESETRHYIANQNRIEMKIDLLLEERDIEWSVITLETEREVSAAKLEDLLGLRSATNTTVQDAERSTKLRRRLQMSNINKGILLPLLSALALFVKQVFGYEIADELINTIADVILFVLMMAGIFIKPKKEKVEEFYH